MLVCTLTSWAQTQPSSARLESRRPCAQISTTPGGSMVSTSCQPWGRGPHIWDRKARKEAVVGEFQPCDRLGRWDSHLGKSWSIFVPGGDSVGDRGVVGRGLTPLTSAHLQTLLSSMLSSSRTVRSAMTTSSTSSSASGRQRRHRALRCMPALGGSAW